LSIYGNLRGWTMIRPGFWEGGDQQIQIDLKDGLTTPRNPPSAHSVDRATMADN
jgi:hypothetical protein